MLRKVIEAAKLVGTVAMCSVLAPLVVADFPSFHRLTVTRVKHRLRGMYHDSYESLAHGFMDPTAVEEEPEQLIIKGVSSKPHDGSWTLGIDLEERVVGHATWTTLTNQHHGGSGDIGVVLLGLPGLIVTSPLLIVWGVARRILRWFTGMDLHTWFVWLKLREQVPHEWRDQVRIAFLNESNGVAAAYWEEKQVEYEAELDEEHEDDFEG